MEFEIIGAIRNIAMIASGRGVVIRRYLDRVYGKSRWRKMKGAATVRLADGTTFECEIHWFEAHGGVERISRLRRFYNEKFRTLH